jgi:o-succinylbenzoate---CoA ligase
MSNSIPKININTIEFLTSNVEQKNEILEFIEEWNNESLTIDLFTSGSTGLPKKITHKKETLIASAKLTSNYFELNKGGKLALCLSVKTIGGKMQLIRALVSEMNTLVLENNRNPIQNLNENIAFCTFTPIQFERILNESPQKLIFIKTILLGGAKINIELKKSILALNMPIYEGFGMTETVSHFALRKINDDFNQPFETLQGVTVSEKNGRLVLSAPHLGIDSMLTNDEIELISPRKFLYLGRTDFVINSGGYKFHPEVLEDKLKSYVNENYFFIGEKDLEFGEIITLFIEKKENDDLKMNIVKLINQVFQKFEKPKKINFIEKFCYTFSGKIDKLATQKKYFESKK